MATNAVPPSGKRCRCGAQKDKAAKRCAKCHAWLRYRRTRHYQKIARRRATHFQSVRHQRKDMAS